MRFAHGDIVMFGVILFMKLKGGETVTKSKKPGETWKGHVSQAVKTRYEAKTYAKILVRIRQDGADGLQKEQIESAAKQAGQSVNQWIIEAIKDKL